MATQTYPEVPNDNVGSLVQDYIDTGAKRVTVTSNPDGTTCTVSVES